MKVINDYLQYIEPSQVPLSAAVYIIKGEQNTYIYDVGRAEENPEILEGFKNKVVVLSHYHGDHCENIDRVNYKQLYVGDLCADALGKGHVVKDMLNLHDGVELCIRACPSVHVGGSLILSVNKEYCLLGDVHLHRATFDSETAWQMLAVLKRMKCKYFLVSHGEVLCIPKEELIAQLEEEYSK